MKLRQRLRMRHLQPGLFGEFADRAGVRRLIPVAQAAGKLQGETVERGPELAHQRDAAIGHNREDRDIIRGRDGMIDGAVIMRRGDDAVFDQRGPRGQHGFLRRGDVWKARCGTFGHGDHRSWLPVRDLYTTAQTHVPAG